METQINPVSWCGIGGIINAQNRWETDTQTDRHMIDNYRQRLVCACVWTSFLALFPEITKKIPPWSCEHISHPNLNFSIPFLPEEVTSLWRVLHRCREKTKWALNDLYYQKGKKYSKRDAGVLEEWQGHRKVSWLNMKEVEQQINGACGLYYLE